MKSLLVSLILAAAITGPAIAQGVKEADARNESAYEGESKPDTKAILVYCTSIGSLAAEIMRGRQSGVAMSEMMKVVQGKKVQEFLVFEAFKRSRYNTPRIVEDMIKDFRNSAELQCFEQLR
jgi:hypothetical protein